MTGKLQSNQGVINPKIRDEYSHPCYPLGFCLTCINPTKGYSDDLCERCAIGYTKAFHTLTKELFDIRQVTKGDKC